MDQKYGNSIKDVIKIISELDSQMVVKNVRYNRAFNINYNGEEYSIEPDEVLVNEQPIGNYSIVSNQRFTVGVYTVLSESLIKEGIVRDMVRHLQNIRKELNFNVEDRIDIMIDGADKINDALIDNKSYFLNEVLGVSFNDNSLNFENSKNIKSSGENVVISIKRNV